MDQLQVLFNNRIKEMLRNSSDPIDGIIEDVVRELVMNLDTATIMSVDVRIDTIIAEEDGE